MRYPEIADRLVPIEELWPLRINLKIELARTDQGSALCASNFASASEASFATQCAKHDTPHPRTSERESAVFVKATHASRRI